MAARSLTIEMQGCRPSGQLKRPRRHVRVGLECLNVHPQATRRSMDALTEARWASALRNGIRAAAQPTPLPLALPRQVGAFIEVTIRGNPKKDDAGLTSSAERCSESNGYSRVDGRAAEEMNAAAVRGKKTRDVRVLDQVAATQA